MRDLENELTKARVSKLEWDDPEEQWHREWWWLGFDAAANIAREVVAEKDAEIARLEADLKTRRQLADVYNAHVFDHIEKHPECEGDFVPMRWKDSEEEAREKSVSLLERNNLAESGILPEEAKRIRDGIGVKKLPTLEEWHAWQKTMQIASDQLAEKDAEIARLEAILSGFGYQHKLDVSTGERVWFKCAIAQPRKVTDAQREMAARSIIGKSTYTYRDCAILVDDICRVIESTGEPARGV